MGKMRIRTRGVDIWEVLYTTSPLRDSSSRKVRTVAVPTPEDRILSETIALIEMAMKDDSQDCKVVGLEKQQSDVLLIEGVAYDKLSSTARPFRSPNITD